MLIVCPNCATSYMIDPASVGPAGRAVRCARCKSTWFAGVPQTTSAIAPGSLAASPFPAPADNVSAFVDGVIAEAEAQSSGTSEKPPMPPSEAPAARDAGDFDDEPTAPLDGANRNTDIESDAIVIADGPSLVPPLDHDALFDSQRAEHEPEDIESFTARRERLKTRRQKAKRTSRWTAIILVLLAINVALIGARSEVVRYLPQTASLFAAVGLPVNLRNLKFDNVKIVKEAQEGVSILIVEGRIENTADKPTEVPRLRFAARNATGQEVYTWTALPERSILGAQENMAFHSRLAAPPADATDVMVRFFNEQDAAAGAK